MSMSDERAVFVHPDGRSFDYLSPYIIAEIGVNHGGDVALAEEQIRQAARGGAHAAKFQTYKAERLARRDSPRYWDPAQEPAESQYELFKRYDAFEEDDYRRLAAVCAELGIDFMSTPFDLDAVDMLDGLVAVFKVASADITNVPLLRKIAGTGKPVVLSTGASTMEEIRRAIDILAAVPGSGAVCLLHCVLNYPTPRERAQLSLLGVLAETFPGMAIGYSDHTQLDEDGTAPALFLAAVIGAVVLEKHFTSDRSLAGNDHYHALDERSLADFTSRLASSRVLLGSGRERHLDWESDARAYARRSIVTARAVKAGEQLTGDLLITKRPVVGGIPAEEWDDVVGTVAVRDLAPDSALQWSDVGR